MADFALSWDTHRPVLVEVLGSGTWVEEDHVAYLERLTAVLAEAPAGGFDLLSNSLDYTMQADAEADHQAYDLLAAAGCRRMVMATTKMSVAMQTQRMIRESTLGRTIEFTHVATMAEADQVLAGWHPSGG
jgi:hypothetical protein